MMSRDVFTYRASEREFAALKRLCSFEELNASEAVRLAIREAAQRRGLWRDYNGAAIEQEASQEAETERMV